VTLRGFLAYAIRHPKKDFKEKKRPIFKLPLTSNQGEYTYDKAKQVSIKS